MAIVFHRLSPYHHARLTAAARQCRIEAVEVTTADFEYPWWPVKGRTAFRIWTLFERPIERLPAREFETMFGEVLHKLSPSVAFIPGWGTWWAIASLRSCLRLGIRVVVMSDSTAHDARRAPWTEAVKRRVVRMCSAALVAGAPHVEYLMALGMPRERIFAGYDIVDNAHFTAGAEAARREPARWRHQLGLPERYFLASSRFVEVKNLPRLLQAYACYRARSASRAWGLVLLGDGPLRPQVERIVSELGLRGHVLMPGFKQYDQLPVYYGLAAAFVHASTVDTWGLVVNEAMATSLPVLVSERCGCAVDLVRAGRNGFTFDPFNTDLLAELMLTLASDDCDRAAMGETSRRIVDEWTPATFARSLVAAVKTALDAPEPRATSVDDALLWALTRR